MELPSSEPLTLLAFACAGALFVALRRPNRAAWPSFASLAAMFGAAALLGAQLDRVPLRYVTLFATSLSLWCTLAYAIHHLLAFGKDPRATAHAARVALAALGVGCAWSLGVSWPLFEMMSFPRRRCSSRPSTTMPPRPRPRARARCCSARWRC